MISPPPSLFFLSEENSSSPNVRKILKSLKIRHKYSRYLIAGHDSFSCESCELHSQYFLIKSYECSTINFFSDEYDLKRRHSHLISKTCRKHSKISLERKSSLLSKKQSQFNAISAHSVRQKTFII